MAPKILAKVYMIDEPTMTSLDPTSAHRRGVGRVSLTRFCVFGDNY